MFIPDCVRVSVLSVAVFSSGVVSTLNLSGFLKTILLFYLADGVSEEQRCFMLSLKL